MVSTDRRAVKGGTRPGHADYSQSASCQDHLMPFLKWLLRRHSQLGGITEIRAIAEQPTKMIWSGYFDARHWRELVEQILPEPDGPRAKIPFGGTPLIGEANFYFTMQPVRRELLARSAYRLGRCQATSDADILGYTLFGADVDPIRPSGISSTQEEKYEARQVANAVSRWLRERGITCIPADSGNGYHLLVPTILYEDVAAASANARTLLHLLDAQFSNDRAKVDTTIYNPGRILKLYGTKSVKGSDLPERPHRFASVKLERISDDVDLFDILRKELDAYRKASEATKPAAPQKAARRTSSTTSPQAGWDAETSNQVMHAVLEKSGLPFRVKAKEDDTFYEFEDCPYHDDPDGQHYECCVIVRGDGSFAAKCMHDEKATWREHFKERIGWDEHVGTVLDELGIARRTAPYEATASGILHLKPSRDGITKVPLTNFTATLVSDTAEDDGAETRHVFEIEAQLRGRATRFRVTAPEFVAMNWPVEHLGAQAVVHAGQGTRDHARAAIQLLSGDVPTQTVYTHLGWRKHGDEWVYLHAGGALGKKGLVPGVQVHLCDPFTRFVLPDRSSRAELAKAVKASVKFLDLAPDAITMPLFAGIWRTAVGATDFSQFLAGPSGTFKTAVAALVQQFWGAGLDAAHLPAGWKSTANANEALAFLCKDAVLVVDDFAPTGSTYDIQKAHRDADQLLRGQGNRSGRGRMRADATLRPVKPPRGLVLSTGEDVPRGQSLRARIFVLEVSPGAVNPERLTRRQRDAAAGLYATALSGFVRWLAESYDWVRHELMPVFVPHFREKATTSDQHKRTPNMVAELYLGLDLFVDYAEKCGALTAAEGFELLMRGWTALGEAASAQTHLQHGSEPTRRFLDLLNAAVAAGKAHVAGSNGGFPRHSEAWGWRRQDGDWIPRGDRVGWVVGNDLYLEPEAAFAAVQSMAQAGGEPLTVSSRTLHRRLSEQNLLASVDTQRNRLVVRRTLEGRRREVLHLGAKAFSATEWDV